MRDVVGDEIFEHLYGDDWRRRQQQDVDEVLADATMRVWVAEQGSQVVGFVAGFLRVDEGMGQIRMLAVNPDSQNRGLGTRLTEVATDWIRESGQPIAVVSTGGDIGHAPAGRTAPRTALGREPNVPHDGSGRPTVQTGHHRDPSDRRCLC